MNQQPLPFQNRARHLNETARRRGRPGRVSATDLNILLAIHNFECYYCGRKLEYEGEYANGTFDHVIPVSRGGQNVKKNLVPCCDPCNYRKDDKLVVYKEGRIGFVRPKET